MTWQLLGDGGLVSRSDEARASGRTVLVDFLCLDLGEGCGEGLGEGWGSDWAGGAVKGCRQRRGEGRGAIGRGGRVWTVGLGGPPSCPQAGWMEGWMEK